MPDPIASMVIMSNGAVMVKGISTGTVVAVGGMSLGLKLLWGVVICSLAAGAITSFGTLKDAMKQVG